MASRVREREREMPHVHHACVVYQSKPRPLRSNYCQLRMSFLDALPDLDGTVLNVNIGKIVKLVY